MREWTIILEIFSIWALAYSSKGLVITALALLAVRPWLRNMVAPHQWPAPQLSPHQRSERPGESEEWVRAIERLMPSSKKDRFAQEEQMIDLRWPSSFSNQSSLLALLSPPYSSVCSCWFSWWLALGKERTKIRNNETAIRSKTRKGEHSLFLLAWIRVRTIALGSGPKEWRNNKSSWT